MKVLGLTLGKTAFGKPLKDGSLTWSRTATNFSVLSEEKFSNVKHAGGYDQALSYLLATSEPVDPDIVAVSSCCEPHRSELTEWENLFESEVVVVDHHLSHAFLSTATSGFEDCLVVVADAGGNVLEPFDEVRGAEWWRYRRQQVSIFERRGDVIELLDRDFDEPEAIGPGEFWRYITYECGFSSSTQASKVMEIAPLGDTIALPSFFELNKESLLRNHPSNKRMLSHIFEPFVGTDDPKRRFMVARWAQFSLEEYLVSLIQTFLAKTVHKAVCLAGGVALNCKAVQIIRERLKLDRLHVSFAPGDKGQSLGNCLAVHGLSKKAKKSVSSPFLGHFRQTSVNEIRHHLGETSLSFIVEGKFSVDRLIPLLDKGFILGTCFERAEVGERALGNSSIIASAKLSGMKETVNTIKGRSVSTPVAPALSDATFDALFTGDSSAYRYMAETISAKDFETPELAAVCHTDGTIRVQTVGRDEGGFLSDVFAAYAKRGSPQPVLFNTSLNGPNRVMVGTPAAAVSEAASLAIDGVMFSNSIFLRRKNARWEAGIESTASDSSFFQSLEEFQSFGAQDQFGSVELRSRFLLFDNYIDWVRDQRKVTTVRFVPGGVSIPAGNRLPLVETKNFRQSAMEVNDTFVQVHGFALKRFGDLNQVDAQRDGFEKTSHLKRTLSSIYPQMTEADFVTINFISICD